MKKVFYPLMAFTMMLMSNDIAFAQKGEDRCRPPKFDHYEKPCLPKEPGNPRVPRCFTFQKVEGELQEMVASLRTRNGGDEQKNGRSEGGCTDKSGPRDRGEKLGGRVR